jgi:translin
MSGLKGDIDGISNHLASKQRRFDEAADLSRALIRSAGLAITLLHNGEVKKAEKELAKAGRLSAQLAKYTGEFEYHTKQAHQEYAEARIFYGIKQEKRIPSVREAGVDYEPYLMGMMDTVGELKRELIGALTNDDQKGARYYYDRMVEIFDSTRSIRFAEAVLQGFRRKQDVARIQIESSASEMLHTRQPSRTGTSHPKSD